MSRVPEHASMKLQQSTLAALFTPSHLCKPTQLALIKTKSSFTLVLKEIQESNGYVFNAV